MLSRMSHTHPFPFGGAKVFVKAFDHKPKESEENDDGTANEKYHNLR